MMMYNKKFLLSIALVIYGFVDNAACGQNTVYDIDRQIRNTRNEIDALRTNQPKRIHDCMMRNSDYRYVQDHQTEIEKLRRENEELLSRAQAMVRRANRGIIFVPNNAMIFSQFCRVPGVSSMGTVYSNNRHRIYQFEQRKLRAADARRQIKISCDSAMYAKIDMCQMRIDSLLNIKAQMIR